jgi:hypothetical protein
MHNDRDLLPWIVGGLMTVAAAIAITAASTKRTAPVSGYAARQAIPEVLPPARAEAAPDPTPAPGSSAEEAQASTPLVPSAPSPPSSNRIWECSTNGQRTFSNSPCGEKSTVREIGPINGMDPTPVLPPTRSYGPQPNYEPDYVYPSDAPAENSYPTVVAVPFLERRRPAQVHRPHPHDRGPAPRKN